MKEKQHIPAGYKSSPLGIIPEDWEVKRLGDLCHDIFSGKNKSRTNDGEYPVYGSTGIIGNSNEYQYEGDKILVARVGAHAGLVSMASGKYDVSDNTIIIDNKKDYSTYFAFQQLVNANLNKLVFGSGQPLITAGMLKRLLVLYPTLSEQKRINDTLSLWDTAISKQAALIEKLTVRKRGLMQQLLTGKKRLKGFEGEWKEVRLGDVASINRGGSPRPIEDYITDGDGYNWIKIGDVGVDAKYITRTEEKIIKEGLSKTRFVKSGDFILSNSMSFGRPYILKIDGCIHDGWLVIQEYDKTFNIDFLYYILGYDTTLAQYKSMAAGSGVLNLNKEIVKEVMLKTPSIDEQKAIATILVESDKEIELANKKLERLQEEKKGLMQVLLTGKRRIK